MPASRLLETGPVEGRQARAAGRPPPPDAPVWDGQRPAWDEGVGRRADAVQVGIVVLLVAETMLFGGLVAAFLVFRLGSPAWPPLGEPRLPVGVTALNTVVLLWSGYAMRRAVSAPDRGRLCSGLGQAVLGGAIFLVIQGFEWARLVGFGLTTRSGAYGAIFYVLVGAHAVHVVGALAWLVALRVQAGRDPGGRPGPGPLGAAGLYWSFVVLLWPILWILLYLW
jgi:heme/copper-type cytochrome/quinol oxidase subunit 3